MNKTPIEWCRTYAADGSFEEGYSVNPVRFRPRGADGELLTRTTTMCRKVSQGCAHCYAEVITRRFWPKDAAVPFPGYTAAGVAAGEFVLDEAMLLGVLRHKKPAKIFWGDMTDLFQESVPDAFLDRCLAVCALTPHITHMFLTKRPERMREYLTSPLGSRIGERRAADVRIASEALALEAFGYPYVSISLPLPNVWLGVSVENQEQADERILELLLTPAAKRFISAEPLLGAVDIRRWMWPVHPWWLTRFGSYEAALASGEEGACGLSRQKLVSAYAAFLDWVIVGGESGAGARPMHPDWARGLRDQCVAAGVPFFFKQWGEWNPYATHFAGDQDEHQPWDSFVNLDGSTGHVAMTSNGFCSNYTANMTDGAHVVSRVGKKAAGALLDGREWRQFPEVPA